MKKVLLIDNYDSFTYNLVQYLQELNARVWVYKNNEIEADHISQKLSPDCIIFSPGPGSVEQKKDIGNGLDILEKYAGKTPILGVCLGHQLIGKYFGADIVKIPPMHGKKSRIRIQEKTGIFISFPTYIEGMRYHSLAIENVSSAIKITACTDSNEIMGIEIPGQKIYGVQFHPESIGTKIGKKILENFLRL
jgi:anthranilate synthase component 2